MGRRGRRIISLISALGILLPAILLFASWKNLDKDLWQHLLQGELQRLLVTSFILISLVGAGSLFIGIFAAFAVAFIAFPGRRWVRVLLALPIAFPTYIVGFAYVGLLDYRGPVLTWARDFGWMTGDLGFRSVWGAGFCLTLCFFPYVYLPVLEAFESQGPRLLEVGASLGMSPMRSFFRLILPMARPWIGAGAILVGIEVLTDFGLVSVFGVDSMSMAIYKSWFGFFSPNTASQLATIFVMISLTTILWQRRTVEKRRYYGAAQRIIPFRHFAPKIWMIPCVIVFVTMPILLGAFLPVGTLIYLAFQVEESFGWGNLAEPLGNSLIISMIVASSGVGIAFVIALFERRWGRSDPFIRWITPFFGYGYAIPGAVLAMGVYQLAVFLMYMLQKASVDIMLIGSIMMSLSALVLRFLWVGITQIRSCLMRLHPNLDLACESVGMNLIGQVQHLYGPAVLVAYRNAFVLIFLETMKEMPLTLMTRSVGWDTLAIKIFQYTSESEWGLAAFPGLIMVALSTISLSYLPQSPSTVSTSKGKPP